MANPPLLINTPSSLIHHAKWPVSQHHSVDEFRALQAKNILHVTDKLKEVNQQSRYEVLSLIDAIQRIGIDYHFENEIDSFLEGEYQKFGKDFDHKDIHHASLSFRLLRQHGYHVPADVFIDFPKQNLEKNTKALIDLFEASQLSIQGEAILDLAAEYSEKHLNAILSSKSVSDDEEIFIKNTLRNPYHKSIPRFTGAKDFLRYYDGPSECRNALLEIAEMDSDMARSIHRNELSEIARWWQDLGLSKEIKLARDQPFKWYAWAMGVLPDPKYSIQRIQLTKPIALIYIIDDIFDVHGASLHELALFAQAVNSWDKDTTEQLPDYMKMCVKALHVTTNEIGTNVYHDYGWNPSNMLRKAWENLLNAYLVEAKWFASGHVPMTDEYLSNGIVSVGMHVALVHLFFLLGEARDDKSASVLHDHTEIIKSVATILRLWDDLGTAKDENQDGHDGSYLTCYMKEHEGSSMETARQEVIKKISEAWKQLNQGCFSSKWFSPAFTKASLNFARKVPIMCSYDHSQGLGNLEEHIKFVWFAK